MMRLSTGRATCVAIVTLLTALSAGSAGGADYPVPGTHLTLRDTGPRATMSLVLRERSIPIPAAGSPDDPVVGGLSVSVFSRATGVRADYHAAPRTAPSGWTARTTPRSVTHTYRDGFATRFGGDIQTVVMRTGGGLKVRSGAYGLALTEAQGAVAVRVTWGSVRVCALFDGASVRKDGPGIFVARNADAPDLPDCDDETLLCGANGCPGQRRFCGDGPVTPACGAQTTQAVCEQEGGCWDRSLFWPEGRCNCPTLDAGKVCHGVGECEGLCVGDSSQSCWPQQSGYCSETETLPDQCPCMIVPGGSQEICIH